MPPPEPGNSLARASMKSTGSPTQISGAFAVGKQSRFARMTQDPVIRTGAGNTLKLMPAAQDPWDPAQLGRAGSREPSRAITCPSEYLIEGVPAKSADFVGMTQGPVIRTGAGNTLKLMQAAQDPWDPAQPGRRRVAAYAQGRLCRPGAI